MDDRIKKIIGALLVIVVSAILLKFQTEFLKFVFTLGPYLWEAVKNAGTSLIWAFWLGILFGMITCPICGVPLASYVIGGEGEVVGAFYSSILFNTGRFVVFVVLGVLAGLIGQELVVMGLSSVFSIAFGLAGFFMMLMSADLFGVWNIRDHMTVRVMRLVGRFYKMPDPDKINVRHPIEYTIWGLILGVVCSLEALFFVVPVWVSAVQSANIPYAVLTMVVFGLGAFTPPTIMVALEGGSVELCQKYTKSNVIKFTRYVGGLTLLYLGLQYMALGLASGTTPLSGFTEFINAYK